MWRRVGRPQSSDSSHRTGPSRLENFVYLIPVRYANQQSAFQLSRSTRHMACLSESITWTTIIYRICISSQHQFAAQSMKLTVCFMSLILQRCVAAQPVNELKHENHSVQRSDNPDIIYQFFLSYYTSQLSINTLCAFILLHLAGFLPSVPCFTW